MKLLKLFNSSFSDYFFPITFTKEQFIDKFSNEGVRLDLSVGVFDNENLVAFILHFVAFKNGIKTIYNGGTGVISTYRGNKLTKKMYDFILPKIKNENIEKMVLEVLIQNHAAIKIYKQVGFKTTRELECFKGKLTKTQNKKLIENYKIEVLQNLNWDYLQSFWDHTPTWQNSISTLKNLKNQNLHIGLIINDKIIGYLVYHPLNKKIHQMAIAKEYRNKGLGNLLLNYIQNIEKQDITCINIDNRIKYIKSFLENRGLKNILNQYEMEYNLLE